MLKVLITGGDGFIARSLTEAFCEEYSVVSTNRNDFDLMDAEKVSEYIKKNSFDIIIHTATYDAAPSLSTKDPKKVLENNLRMFFNVARCEDDFGKMIYFGSGAEFGKDHWKPKMKESYFDAHVPVDPYGLSKYTMSKFTLLSDKIVNLRLFGVFGKYDDCRYRFIPNACCQAALDLPITINQNAVFDFLFIDDLTEIVRWAINRQPVYHIYNACSGKTYEFEKLAEIIIEISGKDLPININKEGLGKVYTGDNSLLLRELHGFRFTPIRQSIEGLYRWYEQNIHLIDKNKFAVS